MTRLTKLAAVHGVVGEEDVPTLASLILTEGVDQTTVAVLETQASHSTLCQCKTIFIEITHRKKTWRETRRTMRRGGGGERIRNRKTLYEDS